MLKIIKIKFQLDSLEIDERLLKKRISRISNLCKSIKDQINKI